MGSTASGKPLVPVVLACLGAILLGFSPIFVRYSDLGPMTTGFYRMLVAIPLVWIWMFVEGRASTHQSSQPLSLKDYGIMGLAGVFFALDLALWNWSIDYTAIVNATLFNNTAAFFVPLLMWLLFSERQTYQFILAALTGLIGCSLLSIESISINLNNALGDVVSLASGVMVSAYVITIKKIRDRLNTGTLMFWTAIATLICLAGIARLFGESFWPLSFKDWISVIGQGFFVHVLGQGFLAYAMGRIPASYGALIMLLAPVTAAIFGWLIYDESLSSIKFIGIIIILMSILAVQRMRH